MSFLRNPNRDLFKGILTLAAGTAAAQLVAIVLQPVLRRLFSPEDFGAYAVFISLTAILAAVGPLRYEMAIVQPRRHSDAVNLFFLGFYINLAFALVLAAATLLFHRQAAAFLNLEPGYAPWLLLAPASVALLGTYQCMNHYLTRQKAFRPLSVNKGMRRIAEGAVQMVSGLARFPAGLVAGDVAGHLANVGSGLRQMRRYRFTPRLHSFRRQGQLARQYRDFPLYYLLPTLLNMLCLMLPTLYINKFFSQETAGFFDLTRLVLLIPASVLTMSVGQVFLQSVSEKSRLTQSLARDFRQLALMLAAMAALKVLLLVLAGPWLLGLYAGAPYREAGEYARILVWGSALRTIASPLSMIFVGLRKLKVQAAWQVSYFVMIAALPLFRHWGIAGFITALAAMDVLAYALNFFLARHTLNRYEKTIRHA
jgi:O-antigen/teichoic acid export membrane protein